jgi:signal transduction histidine kinase
MVEAAQSEPGSPEETPLLLHKGEGNLCFHGVTLLLNHLSQPAFVKDHEHRIVLANAVFCELVGLSATAVLGRSESDILGPRTIAVVPLADATGAATCAICLVDPGISVAGKEDLERYETERIALATLQKDLLRRERYDVLRQVGAVLAHQVRNHLAAVTTAVALARKVATNASASLTQALALAHDAAMDASSVIGDIVEYTKVRPARPLVTSLSEIVSDALELSPPPNGVRIARDAFDADVYVDPIQVRDALRKIIRNAYEAMNGHGEVCFRVHTGDPMLGNQVELRVTDTGDGISEQHRSLIFEPMVTNKPLGLGLGLATALTLVSNQGGTLDAVEHQNGGACFSMRLPAASKVDANSNLKDPTNDVNR